MRPRWGVASGVAFAVALAYLALLLAAAPESPVWLVEKKRFEAARDVLRRIGREEELGWIDEVILQSCTEF